MYLSILACTNVLFIFLTLLFTELLSFIILIFFYYKSLWLIHDRSDRIEISSPKFQCQDYTDFNIKYLSCTIKRDIYVIHDNDNYYKS